jgi:carboxypeptidase Taq
MTQPLDRLKDRLAEVSDLTKTATLLLWDQRVMMPPGGSEARAEALATISRIAQERYTAPEVGKLLE